LAKKKKKAEKAPREFTRRQLSHFRRQQRRQRIYFFGGVAVIAAVVLIILVGWFVGEYMPLHRTMLNVNGVEFNMSYYIDVIKINVTNHKGTAIQVLANNSVQQMEQNELIREGAEKLGITVDKKDVENQLKQSNIPVTDGNVGMFGAQLLQQRLRNEYFSKLVPASDNQVDSMVMMVESDNVGQEVRNRLLSGDNFTALAGEYAQNYYSKSVNKGDFGWHPASILTEQLGSSIPVDFAFSADVGALSEPLSDNESWKQLGYWLIRVRDRPEAATANVSAVLISDLELAKSIKARLEAGEDLGPIADEYSNYSPSQEGHGELGLLTKPEEAGKTAVSAAFDGYVFNPETELGKWSDPIRDDTYWTKGGAWLVKVVDRQENRKLSDEDRNHLIDNAFNDWFATISADPANVVDDSYLTQDMQKWAMDRVTKELQLPQG
jgi:parvulin-like peptidyl-prolyl isomerase